jgi:hypothetical protein
MYTCPEIDIHSVYADGELPEKFAGDYEKHVSTCPECAEKLQKFRTLHEEFKKDAESIRFSKDDLDASFARLEARLSYKKVADKKSRNLFFRGKIQYFAAGIAAALVVAFVLPRPQKSQVQVSSFQPVSRNNATTVSNHVKVDGNINVADLYSMFEDDGAEQNFYGITTGGTVAVSPVMMNSSYRVRTKPSFTSYDVFCPEQENSSGMILNSLSDFAAISGNSGN